jgi:hypothetical protein
MNFKKYILKEILSEAELELFLRLRYNCFSHSASSLFVDKNAKAVDINYYDMNSLHYGIYMQQQQNAEPVGYFRIILEEATNAEDWVRNISYRVGLADCIQNKPQAIFPCLGVYPGNNLEQEFYTRKRSNEKAGEVSRFFIVEPERCLKLSLQIIRSAFAIGVLYLQHAFVGCFNNHSKAYMKFGFRQYPGTSGFSLDSIMGQKEGVILYCKRSYLTTELLKLFKIIQDQFLLQHCLSFTV